MQPANATVACWRACCAGSWQQQSPCMLHTQGHAHVWRGMGSWGSYNAMVADDSRSVLHGWCCTRTVVAVSKSAPASISRTTGSRAPLAHARSSAFGARPASLRAAAGLEEELGMDEPVEGATLNGALGLLRPLFGGVTSSVCRSGMLGPAAGCRASLLSPSDALAPRGGAMHGDPRQPHHMCTEAEHEASGPPADGMRWTTTLIKKAATPMRHARATASAAACSRPSPAHEIRIYSLKKFNASLVPALSPPGFHCTLRHSSVSKWRTFVQVKRSSHSSILRSRQPQTCVGRSRGEVSTRGRCGSSALTYKWPDCTHEKGS